MRTLDHEGLRNTRVLVTPTNPPPPPGGGVDLGDTSGVIGQWFINRGSLRLTLVIGVQAGHFVGTIGPDDSAEAPLPIEHVTWDPERGQLRFRVEDDGKSFFYAVDVVEGTMIGRYAFDFGGRSGPADWSVNSGHLMGWRSESFDAVIVPRIFDIVVEDGRSARLRLDRNASNPSALVGEFKVKGTTEKGADGELPAQPILVRRWDGTHLVFEIPGTTRERFSGDVKGRTIEGVMTESRGGATTKFSGSRANILSYGLRTKSEESRREWQERVRRVLYRLMMNGNPAPLGTVVTTAERPLMPGAQIGADRDDNSGPWQQQYRLTDVVLDHTLPNPYGTEPLARRAHGILAVPTTPPPVGGYPIVLAVNGHGGSAQQHFQSDGYFWYGDSFARRGYMVFALDISHRPIDQAGGIYWDPPNGDSPETGNPARPAIAAPGLDSDWSDDGERVWDSMRGIDFLLSQPSVNPNRIIVTGLSMGAEVTELLAALDPRVTTAVPASPPPDLSLMPVHGNHTCWQWMHGDANEFIDMSDYLALTAPRQVILESGKWDYTYSSHALPYAVEKENAWRARIAYGSDVSNFVHYLHSGRHQYRVGDSSDDSPSPDYIQVPEVIAPPNVLRRSFDWEVDGATISLEQTLFDYLARPVTSR